ncbi:ACT domain-containing protein [Stenotrophomonas mori]|uniref:Acetolactate synthase n=1 Tax=Stenotrophomonas mori TaxID=2871096 RepID=A0ABT0SIH8_9GAMM|nr:ACT domain-containing protein [Stenotrophomonas mori]MCL7715142.1 acetolactate synthase [Stenotrophomonas mori]
MHYRLDLVLKPAEGALVRVIGMVERRGFSPSNISGNRNPDDAGRWHVQMDVRGQRPPETLRHQLEKVYDCESVQVVAVTDTSA